MSASAGWHLYSDVPFGAVVSPVADLVAHEDGPEDFDGCVCGPSVEVLEDVGRAVVTHHSLDGRELRE